MSKRRVLLLNAVVVLLTIGSLYCIVFDTEYWPFSNYPMFSEARHEYSLSEVRLYGIVKEGPRREIPLRASDYIEPFDQSRLNIALDRIESTRNPKRRQELLDKALLDSLKRYEKLRQAGSHDGPPLRGAQLYRERWRLDASAENVDQPNQRELIVEVYRQPNKL